MNLQPFTWVVFDEDGIPMHCAPSKDAAHEHINAAINDYDIFVASKWVVRPAFAASVSEARIELSVNERVLLLDILHGTQDDGPPGEGWKSDELKRLIATIETQLNGD